MSPAIDPSGPNCALLSELFATKTESLYFLASSNAALAGLLVSRATMEPSTQMTSDLPASAACWVTDASIAIALVSRVSLLAEKRPEWAEDIAGVPALSPGEAITVTRTLEPGSYAFLCFFPDPEGTPHAALGMYEVFTIAGDTGLTLPEPDATITATDDGLQVPELSVGEQTVQFQNDGTKPHELVLATFEPGKGVKDVDGWIEGGYEGEPPVTFLGGMQTIPSGESVFFTIDLEPGVEYTALDFQTNSRVTFTVS